MARTAGDGGCLLLRERWDGWDADDEDGWWRKWELEDCSAMPPRVGLREATSEYKRLGLINSVDDGLDDEGEFYVKASIVHDSEQKSLGWTATSEESWNR
jgi:hypothetical protein